MTRIIGRDYFGNLISDSAAHKISDSDVKSYFLTPESISKTAKQHKETASPRTPFLMCEKDRNVGFEYMSTAAWEAGCYGLSKPVGTSTAPATPLYVL